MNIEIKLFFADQAPTALVIRASRTVRDFVRAYLSNRVAATDPDSYSLFCSIDGGRSFEMLESDRTFNSLAIPHGAWLVLSRDVQFPAAAMAGTLPEPQRMPSHPSAHPVRPPRTPYHCTLEIIPGKSIPVSRHGLVLNRRLLRNQLPLWRRALGATRSRLRYISRSLHCQIAFHTLLQQWVLRAERPVYIGGQVYDKGKLYHLQPATTIIRLGRRGPYVRIQLSPGPPAGSR